ncbi:hypothetical protein GCM10007981_06230 [Thermocladium modestius]|uniref:Uncharacterized protein n=1 Tax=Thermocladium modestius TaxID=62609 RepID=A0A830GX44_9CREN|nr:hypothetical protein [Thermocladium modestius]GGP20008.1 hypothetical protein GCM10007981_06230 [Thermocladium modestius]
MRLVVERKDDLVVVEDGLYSREFKTVDDALSFIREKFMSDDCEHKHWYIRFPLSRLLDFAKFIYDNGLRGKPFSEAAARYFKQRGLSSSNVRALMPTLTDLGLVRNGEIGEELMELGMMISKGRLMEAATLLGRAAARNCVLRDMMQLPIDEAAAKHGLSRRDEIEYTRQLMEFIRSSGLTACGRFVDQFFYNSCEGFDISNHCIPSLLLRLMQYLISIGKPQELREIVNPPELYSVASVKDGYIYVSRRDGDIPVMRVMGDFKVFESSAFVPSVRNWLADMEPAVLRSLKEEAPHVAVLLPFLVNVNGCHQRKILLGIYSGDGSVAVKIHDLKDLWNP